MVSTLTSCDVDHVLKWTRLSVRISAVGSKVMRKYIAGELGTRLGTRREIMRTRVHIRACVGVCCEISRGYVYLELRGTLRLGDSN